MSEGSQNFIFSSRGEAELWTYKGFEISETQLDAKKDYFMLSTFEGEWKFFEIMSRQSALRPLPQASSVTAKILGQFPTLEEYKKNFLRLQGLFKEGQLKKIILARQTRLEVEWEDSLKGFLDLIFSDADPQAYLMAFEVQGKTFFSKTPESLLRFDISTGLFETEALAATREPHAMLEDFKNPKDQEEHARVVDFIVQTLQKNGALKVEAAPQELLTQKKLSHLRTPIRARLGSLSEAFRIARALHPTPAVGGWPQELALHWIKKIEEKPRSYYAAPIGILKQGRLELSVALRSGFVWQEAPLQNCLLDLYAGSGLLPLSQDLDEWEELNLKLSSILSPIRVG